MKPHSSVLALLLATAPAWGHGSHIEPIDGALAIRAVYSDGSPMADCEVLVFAGDAPDTPQLSGATDAQGRFAFIPENGVLWTLVVNDGLGHAARHTFDLAARPQRSGSLIRTHRGLGTLAGIGIIFGLFGVYALFRRGRCERGTEPCT